MSKRFNHLNVPERWEHYWSKYPEGYTILEALLNWVKDVDELTDNVNDWNEYLDEFVETFDEKLKPHVESFLKDMEADGRLAEIINVVIFEDLNRKIDTIHVNVTDFGVPVTLSTLSSARDYAIEKHRALFFPGGYEYNFNSDINLGNISGLIIEDDLNFNDSSQRLIIEKDSNRGDPFTLKAGRINVGGVELRGVKNCVFQIGYTPTLDLYADGEISHISSIAYNSFHLARVDNINIHDDNGGWINENKWFGGRFRKVNITGTYSHNHNIFYAPTLESGASVDLEIGSSNQFLDVRFEGSTNTVKFGEKTYNNIVERSWSGAPNGYFLGSYRFGDVVDEGTNNITRHKLDGMHETETLYSMNRNTFNYNTDWVTLEGDRRFKTTFEGTYSDFVDTGMFEATENFDMSIESDAMLWFVIVTLYDATGNKITIPSIINKSLYSFSMDVGYTGSFASAMPRDKTHLSFKTHPDVKYMDIKVRAYTTGTSFSFLNVLYRRKNRSSLVIPRPENMNILRGSKQPTYDLPEGTIVYKTNPKKDGSIGWIFTDTGWEVFGSIKQVPVIKEGRHTVTSEGQSFLTFPHGAGGTPVKFNVMAANSTTGNAVIKYVNITPANLQVFFNTPVPSGQEIDMLWWVER